MKEGKERPPLTLVNPFEPEKLSEEESAKNKSRRTRTALEKSYGLDPAEIALWIVDNLDTNLEEELRKNIAEGKEFTTDVILGILRKLYHMNSSRTKGVVPLLEERGIIIKVRENEKGYFYYKLRSNT